jgi:D-proline reductase (dithiol) PrdB
VILEDADLADVVMSHVLLNFDLTGFQQDLNVCFPIERMHELAEEGVIGSVGKFHSMVSGAAHPSDLEVSARSTARTMKEGGVDTVLLVPIWPKCTWAWHYLRGRRTGVNAVQPNQNSHGKD